eukprot:355800-Chlamydomonas_euryale.AAC.2
MWRGQLLTVGAPCPHEHAAAGWLQAAVTSRCLTCAWAPPCSSAPPTRAGSAACGRAGRAALRCGSVPERVSAAGCAGRPLSQSEDARATSSKGAAPIRRRRGRSQGRAPAPHRRDQAGADLRRGRAGVGPTLARRSHRPRVRRVRTIAQRLCEPAPCSRGAARARHVGPSPAVEGLARKQHGYMQESGKKTLARMAHRIRTRDSGACGGGMAARAAPAGRPEAMR